MALEGQIPPLSSDPKNSRSGLVLRGTKPELNQEQAPKVTRGPVTTRRLRHPPAPQPLPLPTNTQSLFALIEVLLQNFNGTAGVR